MNCPSPKVRLRRTFVLGLLSLITVAALLALAVSAKRARQAASLSANIASSGANSKSNPALRNYFEGCALIY
jgi:hypothetical protein